jgi:flagellar biosynthesis/type III secretory pathway chaperone
MDEPELTRRARLHQLLDRQQAVLRQIAPFAVKQRELIEADRVTALLELLGEKQVWMDQLEQLQAQIEPLAQSLLVDRVAGNDEVQDRVRALSRSCQELLRAILSDEAECQQRLEIRRDRLSQQLETLDQTASAIAAYSDDGQPRSLLDFGLS